MQAAQARYQQAVEHQKRMMEELDQELLPRVDGSFAIAQARRAAALARNEVVRLLTAYIHLAVRGEMPPPDDDERLLI